MELSADRLILWDIANEKVLLERVDAPIIFTRRGDALSALRREIKRRNSWFRAAERGHATKDHIVPYREVTEEDFAILPCKVTFSIERT